MLYYIVSYCIPLYPSTWPPQNTIFLLVRFSSPKLYYINPPFIANKMLVEFLQCDAPYLAELVHMWAYSGLNIMSKSIVLYICTQIDIYIYIHIYAWGFNPSENMNQLG